MTDIQKAEAAKQAILKVMEEHNIRSIHEDNYGCTIITSEDFPITYLFDEE